MFKYSAKELHNKPLHKLLCNGYRFALIAANGSMVAHTRYSYQLQETKKRYPRSLIVEIKSLLVE